MHFGASNVCLLYVLFFLSLNNRVCSALTTTAPVSFITEPSPSTVVFEYGKDTSMTIEMSCKVENLKSDQKVSWLKGLDYTVISDDHVVRTHYLTDNDRYFIVGDESQGEYNLQIRMVSYQTAEFDSGLYHCAVLYDDPTILLAIIRSAFVRLNVYVVPRMMYPQCTVNDVNATDTSEVMEGEAVTLSCQSDAGYPTVSMSWENGNSSIILTESVTVQDDIASVEYAWIPNENDDGVFFICSINHVAFDLPDGERTKSTCAVGPFKVERRPPIRQSTTSVPTLVTADRSTVTLMKVSEAPTMSGIVATSDIIAISTDSRRPSEHTVRTTKGLAGVTKDSENTSAYTVPTIEGLAEITRTYFKTNKTEHNISIITIVAIFVVFVLQIFLIILLLYYARKARRSTSSYDLEDKCAGSTNTIDTDKRNERGTDSNRVTVIDVQFDDDGYINMIPNSLMDADNNNEEEQTTNSEKSYEKLHFPDYLTEKREHKL